VYGWYQYLAVINCCRHRGSAFGTKKLSSLGSDLGASIKGFKKAMSDDDKPEKSRRMQISRRKPSPINRMMQKRRDKTPRQRAGVIRVRYRF
jgi:Sec-independent protein translocase protein TatA